MKFPHSFDNETVSEKRRENFFEIELSFFEFGLSFFEIGLEKV